jgi:hypothetical protein
MDEAYVPLGDRDSFCTARIQQPSYDFAPHHRNGGSGSAAASAATCPIAKRDAFTELRAALLLTLFEFCSRAPLFFDARHRAHQ